MSERKLQSEIIKFLKSKGAYVVKTRAAPGVPVGCPDIIFLFEGAWGVVECKAARNSPYRVGQKATLAHLGAWSPFVYTAYPENWPLIKDELLTNFF